MLQLVCVLLTVSCLLMTWQIVRINRRIDAIVDAASSVLGDDHG